MKFNKYQTQLTEDLIASYPKEVIDELYEYINTVPLIQRLVSPDRKYARDMPRDSEGKIIVDLSNPHILENMDYFRPAALHFQKYGCYTKLKVNNHPHSEFMKWFKQELVRCWEGMVRPEDGEWITGDMYFFLNYVSMIQTVVKINKKGRKYGVRKEEMPEVWEGIYWRFHYLDQARYGGLYNNFQGGLHAAEIASRGKGKSFALASMLARLFTIGISQELSKNRKALIVADLKTYLIEDGTLNKFEDLLAHLAKTTQFPQHKERDSLTNMTWLAGWTDNEGNPRGSQNLVIGQAIGDDPDKSRGKRPNSLEANVITPQGIKKWKDIKVGDYIYGDDGKPTQVVAIPFEGKDDLYRITLEDGRHTDVGKDHLFEVISTIGESPNIRQVTELLTVSQIKDRLLEQNVLAIRRNDWVQFKKQPLSADPYMIGTQARIFNQPSYNKNNSIPKEYLFNTWFTRKSLLEGILGVEDILTSFETIKYISYTKELKDDILFLWRSLGFNGSEELLEDGSYKLRLFHNLLSPKVTLIKSVDYLGEKPCKCVTVDNESHLYLIDDFIINHNSDIMLGEEFGKFGKFSDWWATSMPNVQEGEIVFGIGYSVGTGGTTGSDFSGALDVIYSPESNHIYGIPNIYDKGSTGAKKSLFFYPAFVNYKPFYNEDGVSDVIGAMLSELLIRYQLKYNSTDPLKLTRRKAEFAFTLQDAIMKRDSTIYPVADLNDRVNQLDADTTYADSMYIGKIELTDGKARWKPSDDVYPILHFPHKDNKLEGGVYIKSLPEKDSSGKIPWGRYIGGLDPYDDDVSNTLSLGSMFILDLWTDDIVAEYTGRPAFADDFYEIARRLAILYNAEINYENNKKGLYAHFSKYNSLYLLADTLSFLKDKDPQKIYYGNTAKGTANYSNTKSGGVAAYGRRCLRDYLLKPIEYTEKEIVEGEERDVVKTMPNLFRIKFRAALQELASWGPDGNFDRHDALVMLMLLREDKLRLLGDDNFQRRQEERDADYLGNDDYFENNYNHGKDSYGRKLQRQLENLGYFNN